MLIIVPKSVSSQVRRFFKLFALVNIVIVIITVKFHARTWLWLQDDTNQFYLVLSSNPSEGKYSMMQGLSSLFRSKFPNCRQQSSRMIILWEKLWQCGRINIIGLKEGYHQKNTNFESYLLIKLQYFFSIQYHIFYIHHNCVSWEMFISNNKTYSLFCFYCVRFSLYIYIYIYIYFRDSTYNFRLRYLVLDCITKNVKFRLLQYRTRTYESSCKGVNITFNTNTFPFN